MHLPASPIPSIMEELFFPSWMISDLQTLTSDPHVTHLTSVRKEASSRRVIPIIRVNRPSQILGISPTSPSSADTNRGIEQAVLQKVKGNVWPKKYPKYSSLVIQNIVHQLSHVWCLTSALFSFVILGDFTTFSVYI